MNNRININTIVVFEPDDYLSVTIKDIISDIEDTYKKLDIKDIKFPLIVKHQC